MVSAVSLLSVLPSLPSLSDSSLSSSTVTAVSAVAEIDVACTNTRTPRQECCEVISYIMKGVYIINAFINKTIVSQQAWFQETTYLCLLYRYRAIRACRQCAFAYICTWQTILAAFASPIAHASCLAATCDKVTDILGGSLLSHPLNLQHSYNGHVKFNTGTCVIERGSQSSANNLW